MRGASARPRTSWRLPAVLAAMLVAALVTVGIPAAGPAVAAPDQYAPSIGTATGTLQTGPTNIPLSIRTSARCPAGSTSVNGFLNSTAAGIVDGVAISANQTDLATINTSGMPLNDNLLGIAQSSGRVLVNGRYELSVVCYPDPFSEPTAQFDATFTVSGGTGPTGPGTTVTWDAATPEPAATTTTIAALPAGSAVAGQAVELTATVSPAGAAGTVRFTDSAGGSTVDLGAPVTVTGGRATLSTTSLAVGSHSLTARFVPAVAGDFLPSASPALAYQITEAPDPEDPVATTTTVTATPALTAAQGDEVRVTATIAPGDAAGTVQFTDTVSGSTVDLGGPVTVAAGVASFTTTSLAPGPHSFVARFVPSDAEAFAPSVSTALAYQITTAPETPTATTTTLSASPPGSAPAGAEVTFTATVVPAGAAGTVRFTDTAGGSTVDLGAPVTVAGGTASITRSLAPGTHSVTASFVPTDPATFAPSASAATGYEITPVTNPEGEPTRTRLTATPAPWCAAWFPWRHRAGCQVLLAVKVKPGAAEGSVQIYETVDGVRREIGDPVPVRRGWAFTATGRLAPGRHTFVAVFTPSDADSYQPSTSGPAEVRIPGRHKNIGWWPW